MASRISLSRLLDTQGVRLDSQVDSGSGIFRYEGWDSGDDRRVVVSVVDPEGTARLNCDAFLSAVEILSEVRDDSLVSVDRCGEVDGSVYWVSEQPAGITLRDKLDAHGTPPLGQALHFLKAIASALRTAHDRGVLHLDLGTDKVLVSGWAVKVVGVGIDQALRAAGVERPDRVPQPGTDVAGFGAIAFELLMGREAAAVPHADSRRAAWASALAQRSQVPSDLVDVVLRCLDDTGGDHLVDMDVVVAALDAIEVATEEGADGPESEELYEEIDHYRLVRVLGRGGVGVVYLAEQAEPVERQVALKLIKPGMDTAEVLSRFAAESQLLATMDHPNIARVFDSGQTGTGRPYFVMEFVQGENLLDYCDQHRLTVRERVALLIEVCRAVQHAHQKGVIHRDLKPTNVLVATHDGRPTPRVIDFGLAKAVGEAQGANAGLTRMGQIVGTPAYMSPEQITGSISEIDTRTDVYALGAILHELLTGFLPFEGTAESGDAPELRGAQRDSEITKPSARFSDPRFDREVIAEQRGTSATGLSRELSGDLDWIVLKAMATQVEDRYDTVSAFARELERYLTDEEVEAGAPSLSYRARKFVRRHRTGSAIAATATLALLVGLATTTTQWLRAVEAEQGALEAEATALEEAAISNEIANFLQDVFRQADPDLGRGTEVTARELLDRAAASLDERFPDEPFMLARLRETLGMTYTHLGLPGEAEPLLTQAVAITERTRGEGLDLGRMISSLAMLRLEQGQFDSAAVLLERTIAINDRYREPDDPDHAGPIANLGSVRYRLGDYQRAAEAFRRAAEIGERAGADPLVTATRLANLGMIQSSLGNHEEAEAATRRVVEIFEDRMGPDHPNVARALSQLATVLLAQDRYAEAEPVALRAVTIREEALGPQHPAVATSRGTLADIYAQTGRLDEWRAQSLLVLEIRVAAFGPDHPLVGMSRIRLGFAALGVGDLDGAEEEFRQGRRITEETRPGHELIAISLEGFARVHAARGEYARSDSVFSEAIAFLDGMPTTPRGTLLEVLGRYADMLREAGMVEKMEDVTARIDSIQGGS